jgi:CubicO group peptidase (beta-lactamase class C family)
MPIDTFLLALRRPLADHVARAGFPEALPLAVARISEERIDALSSGFWPDGSAVRLDDRFYVASLAKQVTGTALGVLVRDGKLDADAPIRLVLPDLRGRTGDLTARQLVHHISGLPQAGVLEAQAPGDWTEASALAALDHAVYEPGGRQYQYSNVGYVLLARVIAAVSGVDFAAFIATRIFAPHNIVDIGFVSDVSTFKQAKAMGPKLPLTQGDGGLWSTAPAFARWLYLQNVDAFGVASHLETPGRLSDGGSVSYGWGIGLREHRGQALFVHGGEWPGAVAKSVRCPALGTGVVAMAAGVPFEVLNTLVGSLLEDD